MQASNWGPDSLQDLCIFFCVEHPECLNLHEKTKATHSSGEGGGDTVTSPDHELPVTLCDKLVSHILKTLIPLLAVNKALKTALNALLKQKNICSQLNLLRVEVLSEANLCDIAQNHVSSLNLFGCKEYSYENIGIEMLMRHNKQTLRNLRVYVVYFGESTYQGSPCYSFLQDPSHGPHNFSSQLKDLRCVFCDNKGIISLFLNKN